MCLDCWHNAGSPAIDNHVVRLALDAMREVYAHHGAGGRLHILLDDWNADDGFAPWLWQYMDEHPADSPEEDEAERQCLSLFEHLSEAERYSVLALDAGFWGKE